jgi:hypothetical protein
MKIWGMQFQFNMVDQMLTNTNRNYQIIFLHLYNDIFLTHLQINKNNNQ